MQSPDGDGKKRVGTECECLQGAQKKEDNEGNALAGEGHKEMQLCLKNLFNNSFLCSSLGSAAVRHLDHSRCDFSSSSQKDLRGLHLKENSIPRF